MGSVTDFESDTYLQPQNSGFGIEPGMQIYYTIAILKKKVKLPVYEIQRNLSPMNLPEAHKVVFVESLRRHARITFIPQPGVTEQKWDSAWYTYRPVIPEINNI